MRRRPDCPQEGLEGRRLRGPHPALAGGISNQNSCLASLLAALPLHPVVSAALGGLRNAACSAPSPRSLPCLHRGRRPSLGVSHQTSERRAPGSHPAARPSEGPGAPAPEWQGEQPGTQGSVCLLLSSFRWDNSWDRKLCLFTRSTFSYGAPAYPGGSHCPRPWGVREATRICSPPSTSLHSPKSGDGHQGNKPADAKPSESDECHRDHEEGRMENSCCGRDALSSSSEKAGEAPRRWCHLS